MYWNRIIAQNLGLWDQGANKEGIESEVFLKLRDWKCKIDEFETLK